MELTEKDRQALKIVGVLVPIVIAAVIFLPKVPVPGVGTVQGLKAIYAEKPDQEKIVKQKENEVKEKERKLKAMPAMLARVDELQKEVDFYESRLPASDRLDDLLSELNKLARLAGQKYVSMKMLPPEPKSNHVELPLEINLITDYHNLGNFMNMTENSERFSKVDDFTIEGSEEVPGQVNVELTLSTFKFVPETEKESDDQATTPAQRRNR